MINEGETLIFDLDGTLVDSSAFEDDCYLGALREALGDVKIDGDWSGYRHVSDTGILQEILATTGEPNPTEVIEAARTAFGRRIDEYFRAGGACHAIPGARETIASLLEAGHAVGVATGGWRHTAGMKLAQAGFDTDGLVVSSCDDATDRVGIMTNCLAKLAAGSDRVVYFGDGPWDQQATAELGWRFIGVGPRLSGQCRNWIADFLDPNWPLAPAPR